MAEDKVIKSGQITLPRVLFLIVAGGIIVATVALGGVWLTIGYWLMTLAIAGLLFAIAMDYGVKFDKVDLDLPTPEAAGSITSTAAVDAGDAAAREARTKRRASRQTKRRR